jgi:2-polyprenyl-6-methoxyphenol hydroxylase-like FAD-dependent oxidoreductase
VRLRTDVLIIGAGPAGLTLAALLAVHGVDLQILDSKSGPVGQSRAALVQCSVMSLKVEPLDQPGIVYLAHLRRPGVVRFDHWRVRRGCARRRRPLPRCVTRRQVW